MNLSPRQQQVAALVVQGYSNKRIARELELKLNTVVEYIARISIRIGGEGSPRARIFRWHYEQRTEATGGYGAA